VIDASDVSRIQGATAEPGALVKAEIGEQPAVVARLLEAESGAIAAAAEEIRARTPRYVVIAARGSSDNVARYAQHLFGRFLRLPVALATPSLHTLYDAPPSYDGALVIGISQSGASPDIVSVLAEAEGAVTVAVTNEPRSDLAGAARHVIRLHAGEEASVAATKTYTASLAALAALVTAEDPERRDELAAMPEALARQLERPVEPLQWRRLAVLGRGANYGTAFEAALKLKELGGTLAEPYSPADFMHGPIAVVQPGYPVLAFAISGPALAGDVAALDAVRARGGAPAIVTDAPEAVAAPGEPVFALEPVPEWLSPLVAVVPAQRLAVAAAEELGVDADQPFGLEKVTRTR
jgi:glucosamine--fructose-6-phosphate aminotransferase (isomerizing)